MTDQLSRDELMERVRELEEKLHSCRGLERALSESERKYSRLIESSLTGIYVDQDGRIVFANDEFCRIYSYAREELIGIESSRLVYPDDRPMTDRIRAQRLRGENPPSEYDARGLTKDGRVIWVRRRNTEIEYDGRPAILGNIADITEEKQIEEELRRINDELEEFAHVLSHDLRTPIVSIRGFTSRLLRLYSESLDQRGVEYLKLVDASARRIEVLVGDLRTLLKSGQIAYAFEMVPAREIVESVLSVLSDRLNQRHIEVVLPDDLPVVCCDRDKIHQVFENLMGNAAKYMGDNPDPRIEIGCRKKNDVYEFWVRDNGIGIDPGDHERIFAKFERGETAGHDEGSGLGLAIVERIVQRHGGRVRVESEKGKGATFYFTLSQRQCKRRRIA